MHSRYDRVVVEQAAIAGALRPSVAGNPAEAEVWAPPNSVPVASLSTAPSTPPSIR
jgi:hypothetical protein